MILEIMAKYINFINYSEPKWTFVCPLTYLKSLVKLSIIPVNIFKLKTTNDEPTKDDSA